MLRFITTEVLAFHTSSTGMPAIGLFGSSWAEGLTHRDIGIREVLVQFIHFEHDVVRHSRLGQQDVHMTGHATGDRVNPETHVDALVTQELGDLVDRVLRLGDGHAVAGHDDHVLGLTQQFSRLRRRDWHDVARLPACASRLRAALSAESARNDRKEVTVALPSVPNPPAITAMK